MSSNEFEELLVLLAVGAEGTKEKPLTSAVVKERLRPFFRMGADDKAADARIATQLSAATNAALIEERRPPKARSAQLSLSEAGRRRVEHAAGHDVKVSGWTRTRDTVVIPLALGVDLKTGAAFSSFEKLRAYLVLDAAGIPFRASYSPAAVLNLLAAQSLGSKSSTQASVKESIVARVLAKPSAEVPTVRESVAAHSDDDLHSFAERVRAAAAATTTGRVGRDRVFISHVLKTLGRFQRTDHVRERLLQANRHGLLQLARADLVADFPVADVEQSELKGPIGDVYHFIVLEV